MPDDPPPQAADNPPQAQAVPDAIHNVTVKLPAFMETSVSNWFLIAEAQFHLRKITQSDTKYYHIISVLPTTVLDKLNQEILATPDYQKLKDAIVERFEKSKPEMFAKMLSTTSMTGKPSLFLQELTSIAEKIGVGEDLVKHQFLQAVPASISPLLFARKDDLPLVKLGKLADDLMPYVKSNINHVSTDSTSQYDNINKISAHNTQQEQHPPQHHTKQHYSQQQYQQHYPQQQRHYQPDQLPLNVRPYKPNQRTKICRAHLYYGTDARNCKPWCKFPNKPANIMINPSSRAPSPAPSSEQKNV